MGKFGNHFDFRQNVRSLNTPNVKTVSMVGHASAVPTTGCTIWENNTIYSFPTSAQTVTLSSSSTNDTVAGTGAQYVYVEYLDSNWAEKTVTLATNGQTGVAISESVMRVNSARVVLSGSNRANVGTIYLGYGTVTVGVPANILSRMDIGDSMSHTCKCKSASLFYSKNTG